MFKLKTTVLKNLHVPFVWSRRAKHGTCFHEFITIGLYNVE